MLRVSLSVAALTCLAAPAASAQAHAEIVRLGTPPNPAALLPGVSVGPIVGYTWDPVIDHTTFLPGAVLDFLAMGTGPVNVPLAPFGTLLCDPIIASFASLPNVPFSVFIPGDTSLGGISLSTQGVSWDPPTISLTNALDLTLGNEPCTLAAQNACSAQGFFPCTVGSGSAECGPLVEPCTPAAQAACIAMGFEPCTPQTGSAACGPMIDPCTPEAQAYCKSLSLYPCTPGTGSADCGDPCICGPQEQLACALAGQGLCIAGGSCLCT